MSCMTKRLWLLVVPFALLNSVILTVALFKTIRISLGHYPLLGLHTTTFEYYRGIFSSKLFTQSLLNSLTLAVVATLFSLILGLVTALQLVKLKKGSRLLQTVYQIPITLPHLIVALMVMQIFSQSGILSRIAYQTGLISEVGQFPLLIHDDWGIGILLVFLYKEAPYVAISILAILKQLDFGFVEVAKNLGASKRQIFFKITLPLVQPTLATLFIILFCFTFASFEVPFLLGNPSHELVAVTAYDLFTQADLATRPQAFALTAVMTGVSVGVTVLTLIISRLLPGGRKGGSHEKS